MVTKNKDKLEDITFFTGVDRRCDQDGNLDSEGRVLSEYPAFYHTGQIEDLREEISRTERNIHRYRKGGIFDEESLFRQGRDLKASKAKLELLEASKPRLNATQQDRLWEISRNLTQEVKGLLFSKSQMHMGTCSPHEEAARIIEKKISVDKLGITPDLAKNLNMKLENGKAARGDLERALKIVNKTLGENTNIEALRADRTTFRGRG